MKRIERVSLEERLLRKATNAFKARRRELEDLDYTIDLLDNDDDDEIEKEDQDLQSFKQLYEKNHAFFK